MHLASHGPARKSDVVPMENQVAIATDIVPHLPGSPKESPVLSTVTIERCAGDCGRCVVQSVAELLSTKASSMHARVDRLQRRFDKQAFGVELPGDEYTRTLPEKEASLHAMAKNIAGCDKAEGNARLVVVSMLGDARQHMSELVKAERALFIAESEDDTRPSPAKEEEPFVPPVPWTPLQRFLRSFGIKI